MRWVASKKMELVNKIKSGELSADQACIQHAISYEELEDWMKRAEFGEECLKAKVRFPQAIEDAV